MVHPLTAAAQWGIAVEHLLTMAAVQWQAEVGHLPPVIRVVAVVDTLPAAGARAGKAIHSQAHGKRFRANPGPMERVGAVTI